MKIAQSHCYASMLLLASICTTSYAALENQGALTLGGYFSDVEVADIDGDGQRDLLVLRSDQVYVYRNTGGMFFAPPQMYGVIGEDAHHLEVGDVDGDGDLDMVVATSDYRNEGWMFWGGVNFFTNDGTGQFDLSQFEESVAWVTDMVLGDVDRDGDLDVVEAGEYSSGPTVVFSDASIVNAVSSEDLGGSNCPSEGGQVALMDWDADGDLDIWNLGITPNRPACFYSGNGAGDFTHWSTLSGFGVDVQVYDVDGDDDLDRVELVGLTSDVYRGDSIIVRRNLGDGTLAAEEAFVLTGTAGTPSVPELNFSKIALGDWNDDGHLDLALSAAGTLEIRLAVVYGNAAGTFTPANMDTYAPDVSLPYYFEPSVVAIGDLDDDGVSDILVGEPLVGTISFYLTTPSCPSDLSGDGVVGFSDLTELLAAWGTQDASSSDLDADGRVGFADLTLLLSQWGPCT